jgi:hypothetical protein
MPLLKPTRVSRRVGAFVAVDDAGNKYIIIEYQDFFGHHLRSGRLKWLAGLKDFRLQDGQPLYPNGHRTFVIGTTGVTIRQTTPVRTEPAPPISNQ